MGCHVSREVWGRYERNQVVPGGDVLFSFAGMGADICYVLTGQRSETTEHMKRLRRANDAAVRALVAWCGFDVALLSELQSEAFEKDLAIDDLIQIIASRAPADRPLRRALMYPKGGSPPGGVAERRTTAHDELNEAELSIIRRYRNSSPAGQRAIEQTTLALSEDAQGKAPEDPEGDPGGN